MNHALIILCGGGSTRMGTDKALLPFGEVSLLEYLVNKYKPHFPHIYLSVKKPGEYTHLSLPITEIADLYMNAGPMSGVFSGLSMMDEDQAFIPSGYQGRLLSGAPASSLHLTNLRTAANPASSLRKKFRPGTGCSTSAEGIVPEPA